MFTEYLFIFDVLYCWLLKFLTVKIFLGLKKEVPVIGIRPLIFVTGLLTLVGQYPEVPSKNTGHFQPVKNRHHYCLIVHFIILFDNIHCIFSFDITFSMTFDIFIILLTGKA